MFTTYATLLVKQWRIFKQACVNVQENVLSANVKFVTLLRLTSWERRSAKNSNKTKGGLRSAVGLFFPHDALVYSCLPLEIQVEIMN